MEELKILKEQVPKLKESEKQYHSLLDSTKALCANISETLPNPRFSV
jgi:hypothetical protein